MTERGYGVNLDTPAGQTIMATEAVGVQGNIVAPQWLHHLRTPSGQPNALAALILSDIVYWYRPIMDRNESTGQPLPPRKKFKADKLQRSYDSYAEMFGFSKRQVKRAFDCLQEAGVVELEFRHIRFNGGAASNVMFIELRPEVLQRITYDIPEPEEEDVGIGNISYQIWEDTPPNLVTPPTKNGETYTEITTEITTPSPTDENTDPSCQDEQVDGGEKTLDSDFAKACDTYRNNISDISPILADKIRDLLDEFGLVWFTDAIEIAVENNARSLNYIRAVCERRRAQGASWTRHKNSNGSGSGGTADNPLPTHTRNGDRIVRDTDGNILYTIPQGA